MWVLTLIIGFLTGGVCGVICTATAVCVACSETEENNT